jgi:cysteine dioxygenase
MEEFLNAFSSLKAEDLEYDRLKEKIIDADPFAQGFNEIGLSNPEPGAYSRKKILSVPLEITIVKWPSAGESAIHSHRDFWGFVAVIDGIIENMQYDWEGKVLKQKSTDLFSTGALIPEPSGVIHKISNIGNDPALTLHFYFPALDSFEGMKIFDLDKKRIGILGKKAWSASWNQPSENFYSIENDSFETEPDLKSNLSFSMVSMFPKPNSREIKKLTNQYFSELADDYDSLDTGIQARSKFIKTVNKLVSDRIIASSKKEVTALSIGCGTGRRDIEILDSTRLSYKIFGVDLSEKMCIEAKRRGINAKLGAWMEVDFDEKPFDFIYFLFGFGHLSDQDHRLEFLKKVRKNLKKGGEFLFDAFNLHDQFEWGPKVSRNFEVHDLLSYGFDKGDIFYRKEGQGVPAFMHYFSEEELEVLLKKAGFSHLEFKFIGYRNRPGEIVEKDEGVIFISAVS